MDKKIIAFSHKIKVDLDDDYTLYDDGEILHEYDKNKFRGNYNLKEILTPNQLNIIVKQRLLDAATDENKELVSQILGL